MPPKSEFHGSSRISCPLRCPDSACMLALYLHPSASSETLSGSLAERQPLAGARVITESGGPVGSWEGTCCLRLNKRRHQGAAPNNPKDT